MIEDNKELFSQDKIKGPNPKLYPDLVMPNGEQLGYKKIIFADPLSVENKATPSIGELWNANYEDFNTVARPLVNPGAFAFWNKKQLGFADGYDPIKANVIDALSEDASKDYGNLTRVLSQYSEKDALLTAGLINKEVANKKIREQSGLFANLATGFGVGLSDPINLIPIAAIAKYAKMSSALFVNGLKTAATMAPSIALQNAILTTSKETESISDWAWNTAFETFLAGVGGGAYGYFTTKGAKGELANAKIYFKAAEKDFDIKFKLNDKGEIIGREVVTSPLSGVGAAEAHNIQALLNSGHVSFKDNGFVRTVFGLGSPIIKGVTSKFPIVRKITDELWSHPFRTGQGDVRAIADPSARDFVRFWEGAQAASDLDVRSLYFDMVGVDGYLSGTRAVIGEKMGKWISEREFNELVGKSYRRGATSDISQVAKAARIKIDINKQIWERAKQTFPNLEDDLFTSIDEHLMRIYDKAKIQERPDDFARDAYNYMKDVNDKVANYKRPILETQGAIRNLNDELSGLKKLKTEAAKARKEVVKQELVTQKETLKALNEQKKIDVANGTLTQDMFQERLRLTPEQRRAAAEIKAPMSAAKERLNGLIKKLNESLRKGEKASVRKPIRSQIKTERLAIKELRDKFVNDVINDKIPKELTFTNRFGHILLKDPDRLPKLRKFKDDNELMESAKAFRDTVLQLNEDQMHGMIFDHLQGGGPNPLMSRTMLWNDAIAEPWLVNDITVLSNVYSSNLTKRIFLADVFKKNGIDIAGGKKGIVKWLKHDYDLFKEQILEEPASAARTKKLKALDADLRSNQELLGNYHDAFLGSMYDKRTTSYRWSNALRQFGSAVLLTNLPILQLTEFFTPFYKLNFSEYIFEGLTPTISKMRQWQKHMEKKLGASGGAYVRGRFADAGLGMNVANGKRLEAMFGYGTQYMTTNVFERYAKNLSRVTQNVSGVNHIMDMQETFVASSFDSTLMRILHRFERGEKLLAPEINFLDEARINPRTWAKRMVAQFNKEVDGKRIGEEIYGGYVSNYHMWDDFEASQALRIGIERHTRSVLTKPDIADVPFTFKDPVVSMLTQFLSWPFAATSNFLVPAITEPEGQKFIGILLMMASGSLIDPLRQLAKGEDVDMSFEALAASSLANSGVMGWQYDIMVRALATLDLAQMRPGREDTIQNKVLRILRPDRYKDKKLSALFSAPVAGVADMSASVVSALLSGEYNKQDAQKTARLMAPFLYTWYTQNLFKKGIDSTNLPKNRSQAKRN